MNLRHLCAGAWLLFALACGGQFDGSSSNRMEPSSVGGGGGNRSTARGGNGGSVPDAQGGSSGIGAGGRSSEISAGATFTLAGWSSVGGASGGVAGGNTGPLIITNVAGWAGMAGGLAGLPIQPYAGAGPVTDTIGADPFRRAASSGYVIANSDGRTANELVLASTDTNEIYVAGATRNPGVLGAGSFEPEIVSEAFLVKLTDEGQRLWGIALPSCGVPVDLHARGTVVRALCPNEPTQTTVIGPTCPDTALLQAADGNEGRLIGAMQVKTPAIPIGGSFCPTAIAIGNSTKAFVTGIYYDVTQIERAMVVAFSWSGQQDWLWLSSSPTDVFGSLSSARPYDADVDANGNVVFVGAFNNVMKLGTTMLTSLASSNQLSNYNGFIGRLTTSANSVSAWRFGGPILDAANAVKSTLDGGFVVAGTISGSATIGGRTASAAPEGSAFVARLDAEAQALWVKILPGQGQAKDLAVTKDGLVHVVGAFADHALYHSYDPATDRLTSHYAASPMRPGDTMHTNRIVVTNSGAIWLAGIWSGSIDLGGGPMTTETQAAFLWRAN